MPGVLLSLPLRFKLYLIIVWHHFLCLSIMHELETTFKKFFWNASSTAKKTSHISWGHISKPKSVEGLGFKNLALMNKEFC